MEAKIEKISELSKLLSVKTRMSDDLFHLFGKFGIGHLLSRLSLEKQDGVSASELILSLCLFRIVGESIHSICKHKIFQWSDSRRYAVLPYIYRHGLGKDVHRISNHGRTLFGHGGQSHGTHVMEASACLYRTHSSCFRRNIWVDAPTPYDYDLRQRQRDGQNPCNG